MSPITVQGRKTTSLISFFNTANILVMLLIPRPEEYSNAEIIRTVHQSQNDDNLLVPLHRICRPYLPCETM